MIASLEARVRETEVGEHIYFASDGIENGAYESCAYAAFRALADSGRTVAFAESITGGLCAKMLSDIPGASAVLRGSAVTYATDTKTSVLGVDAETVEKYGVVSEQTAAEMARGARERFGSDIAVSTTGIADSSPYCDGRGIEPGTVCIGFADGRALRGDDGAFRIASHKGVRQSACGGARHAPHLRILHGRSAHARRTAYPIIARRICRRDKTEKEDRKILLFCVKTNVNKLLSSSIRFSIIAKISTK